MKTWLPPPALHSGCDSWKQEVHTSQEWKRRHKNPSYRNIVLHSISRTVCLKGWVGEDYLWAVLLHKAKIIPWLSTERTFSKTVNGKRQAYLSSPRAPGESIGAHPDIWFQASEIWVTSDGVFMTKYKQAGGCQTLWTPYLDGTCWLHVYRTRETLPVLPLGRTPPRQAHHSSTAFVQN